ncbi:MAG: metallophosphoesterase family protein [Prevotella sp.]
MKKIGIISDTHAYWDDKYAKYFESCDEIWHAGDIGSMEVAEKLAAITPLRAVYGNCDGGDLRRIFKDKIRFKCEDVEVLMTHIGGYPGNYEPSIRGSLYASPPQLFICGHSHILKVQFDKTLNMLHINPGAAGLQGWHQDRTLIRLIIEGNKFTDCEVITLSDSSRNKPFSATSKKKPE